METRSATKKPSLLGSFFDKARSFNLSGFSKASSELTSPTQQESPKFKRKSVIITGTFGPTQFDQTPTKQRESTEKTLITPRAQTGATPRALTSDFMKLDPRDGDGDSIISPESLPDYYMPSDNPLSPVSGNNAQEGGRIRLKLEVNTDVRSTIIRSEPSNPQRQVSALKPTEECGPGEEGDSKASPWSKPGSPRNLFEIGENDKVDSIMSSAYFGKLSMTTPTHSAAQKGNKKEFAKESDMKSSEAETIGEIGSSLAKKISLTQGLSLRHNKSSFLRFLPGSETKGDESPAIRTKDLTLTTLYGLSPLKLKTQSKKSIPELSSISLALDKIDGELVKHPSYKSKSIIEEIVEEVPWSFAIKRAICHSLVLLVFAAITFGVLTVAATVITVPYENKDLVLWIDFFFQGFFLGGLAVLFLKVAMRIARKEVEDSQKKLQMDPDNLKKKSKDLGFHIFSGVLVVCTGLSMLGMGNEIPHIVMDRLYFVLINAGLLFILAIIFSAYFWIKNRLELKRINGHKTHGYFAVRVYKNFMSDLYSTRGMLSRVDTNLPSPDGSRKELKLSMPKLNEEGIDKYKQRNSFEVVTTLKILGSQLIILIAYIQFIAIMGLIKLYKSIQENQDGYLYTIPLLLAYPVIMYIFAKIVEVVDRKTKVNMLAHGYYLSAAFAAIFYQLVRYYFVDLKSLWVMIGCKAFYKAVVYILFGVKADFWKVTVVEKIKEKFRKKQEGDEHEAPKKRNAVKIVKLFALRFVLIEIADIFYGLVSLILVLINRNIQYSLFFNFVDDDKGDDYFMSTWIEVAVDGILLLLVPLCWSCSKAYKKIEIGAVLKQYFMPYIGDYMYITLVQLISFLCLVHKFKWFSIGGNKFV